MRALYRVIVASKTLAAAVSGQLSEKTLTSASTVREIPTAQRLTNLRTWMRLPRAFAVLFGATAMSIVSGCTAFQTQENTLEQIATIEDVRYSQLLTNVSAAISQRDSVPSQGVPSNGTATTSATGVLAFTLTQPFAFAKNTKTFTPTAMLNWQNNWSITPISDPQDLQNLRALYGLIYRTDAQVAEFIGDTMKIQGSSTNKPIDMNYLLNFWAPQCGISLNPPSIQNPNVAMESYLNALKAFPQYSSSYRLLPNQKQNSTDSKQNQQKILTTVCYGDVSSLGLANDSIAYQYGLLYPTISEVFQLENMFVSKENGIVKGNILFTRWLFWKAPDGSWAPNEPPFEPEYLGKYGARDFWTTSPACINDFIILTINATANSHAAAENAPKVTPTPALQQ
jgi:hypothetical protein